MKEYDLIVIGTGSAGQNAAYGAKSAGWTVAIIDSLPFGGTCALRGCDPKKVLVGIIEVIDRSEGLKGKGIDSIPKINWKDLMKFKRTFTEPVPKSNEKAFENSGIETYHGKAAFTGKNSIMVNSKELKAKHFVIAVGDTPMKLNIKGEEHLTYSDEFLELDELPKDITFIGGGYISFEFAHIAARAGSKVRVLHRSSRALKNFDQDIVKMLLKEFEDIGIDVILDAPVTSIERKNGKLIVAGKYETDMVVHGAGRVANVEDLNLEKAGVEYDKKGIKVNEYLQTSNTSIYAGGDCVNVGLALTPVAGMHGNVIAKNLLNGNKIKTDHTATASAVFTYPVLAMVGLTEERAKKLNIDYEKSFGDSSSWYNVKRIGLKHSAYKILTDKNGYILGAHLLYPNADDVINIFVLAIKNKIKTKDLKEHLFTFPSNSLDAKYMV
ncbi:MAG: NAD(P)/FAD-dependent oxidoreductase [Candidatus Dadabacteria bacterium]|nr:NAD(P)/FAD-dependent oxidoreductase [Candidatus Dadabacteria bacterium]